MDDIQRVLLTDGIICYPTEAVWGLGCHPQSEQAFSRLLAVKQRPLEKGVILIASSYEQLAPYVKFNDALMQRLVTLWPGFVTCVLPKSVHCPDYLCGEHDSIAVRLTTHEPVKQLCEAIHAPLVSTSANLSGQPTVKDLTEAKQTFGAQIDAYVDAPLGGELKPSRIIQFTDQTEVIIRE